MFLRVLVLAHPGYPDKQPLNEGCSTIYEGFQSRLILCSTDWRQSLKQAVTQATKLFYHKPTDMCCSTYRNIGAMQRAVNNPTISNCAPISPSYGLIFQQSDIRLPVLSTP